MGNIRFAVTYKPQNDSLDRAYAKERAMQVAKEWSEAMQTGGAVKDFVAVGDVQIKVIGADNQILDSEVPVRQMLEQIVAKTGHSAVHARPVMVVDGTHVDPAG